ncbi:hypothetical protein [Plantactinospora mayteni]|uniref:Nitrate/nitrite sensing protein domain-containing protein n=1 Tax=Plantactinospora mayteni TaxID=566021 RepID=A0ABQ4ENQ4_9ACTN|nr:hypothetical protein [Plantactinospora mayteni]GIG96279.1 hypothetical protein Pma05_28520 [Plantactinospora mayteni]
MTVPAQRSRRAPNRTGTALRVLLAVAVLVPAGVLFHSAWRSNDERLTVTERERHGVEYLRSLGHVTLALVDAQSGAVAGRAAAAAALRGAVEQTSAIDVRYGAELRTSERWAGLHAKIEALPDRPPADPQEAWTVYTETTDLLLALYAKVRESSGLIRDPESDTYHLQDAAGEELPEALIAAGRLADRAVLAAGRSGADRLRTASDLALARADVLSPADDLVENLRAAVENTTSRTLGGNLLSRLDGYQRAVEELSTLTRDTAAPDPIQVGAARASAQLAGSGLTTIILAELDTLLRDRVDGLTGERRIVVGALVLAVLLVLALAALPVLAARSARNGGAPAEADEPTVDGLRPTTGTESGPPPAGPPLAESALPVGAALAGGLPPLPERRPRGTDPTGDPGRRPPLADWQDPVPAGQAAQSTAADSQAPWGRPDAR